MLSYEHQYIKNLVAIFETGVEEYNERTGITTKRLPSTQIVVDLSKEFPILQSKKVFWKSAVGEVFWMFQKCDNNVNNLNSKIWDKWADEDGSIGKTYGYQIGQRVVTKNKIYSNQVKYVLDTLAKDPSSRQCVIDMWSPSELIDMNLPPCIYSSVWSIIDGKLNCMVVQRSCDYPVGVPFDTTEYAILVHMFARHLNVKPGILTHCMADSHIYKNQYVGVQKQLEQYYQMKMGSKPEPKLVFKSGAPHNFWDLTLDDIQIENYQPEPAIKFEVAV